MLNLIHIYILLLFWIIIICLGRTEEQWRKYEGQAYYIYDGPTAVNYTTAKEICNEKHANLPVIRSAGENDFITSKLMNQYYNRYWLTMGAPTPLCSCNQDCQQCRESWTWSDSSRMTYSKWKPDKPQGDERRCAFIYGGAGDWDDTSCSNTQSHNIFIFRYVCQYNCLNGVCQDHQCSTTNSVYKCNCTSGFTGMHCDTDIDDCLIFPCLHNGQCIDGRNSYSCECRPGYTGRNCESDIICQSSPCLNGGSCSSNGITYQCTCALGYTGNRCETDIDECLPRPCQHGGSCINLIGSYLCNCPSSHTGANCQEEIDECLSKPCRNDATCEDAIGSYTCECKGGYTGTNCESDINECRTNPCRHNGVCKNIPGSYICNCTNGFEGNNCQHDIDECIENPCQHAGYCINSIGSYSCNCQSGFTDANCTTDIDECAFNPPCLNNGTCVNFLGSYNCTCAEVYGGPNCEQISETRTPEICKGAECLDIPTLRIILAATAAFAGLTWIGTGVFAFLDYRKKKRFDEEALVQNGKQKESEETGFHNIPSTSKDLEQ